MPARKIVIVEDEIKIATWIQSYLEEAGFRVFKARHAATGELMVRTEYPDLVILDINLPDGSGLDVCKMIRANRYPMIANVPIIMLTANAAESDKILGLGSGADDYMTKPFSPKELVARVEAIFRRLDRLDQPKTILQDRDLVVDLEGHHATLKGEPLDLTPNEFAVLVALLNNQGMVLSRAQLIESAFGHDYEGQDRSIDVYVRHLRRKIEQNAAEPSRIVTVFGVGYRYE